MVTPAAACMADDAAVMDYSNGMGCVEEGSSVFVCVCLNGMVGGGGGGSGVGGSCINILEMYE